MRFTNLNVFGLIICSILFSACSITPNQPDPSRNLQDPDWLNHKAEIEHIDKWHFSGRFSAQNETDSWHGSINWSQNANQYNILISGPLNSGSLSLAGDSKHATLKLAENKIYKAQDPELLLETYTGIHIPINNLRYWVLGTPAPLEIRHVIIGGDGMLSQLTQMGWDITFKNYSEIRNISLPKKIFLENHEFDVRLIIQSWRIDGKTI